MQLIGILGEKKKKENAEAIVTVADAGILPDISWYTVWRGSLMGKLLANLKTKRHVQYLMFRPVKSVPE